MPKRKAGPKAHGLAPPPQKKTRRSASEISPEHTNDSSSPADTTASQAVASNSTPDATQPSSPAKPKGLMDLPTEVRDMIYSYAFALQPDTALCIAPSGPRPLSTSHPLLRVNRQLHTEIHQLLNGNGKRFSLARTFSTFHAKVHDLDFRKLMALPQRAGPANFRASGRKKLHVKLSMSATTSKAHGAELDGAKLGNMLALLEKFRMVWLVSLVDEMSDVWMAVAEYFELLLGATERDSYRRLHVKYLLDVLQARKRGC